MSLNFVIFFMLGLQKAEKFPATENFTIIIIVHLPVSNVSHSAIKAIIRERRVNK